MLIEKDIAGPN